MSLELGSLIKGIFTDPPNLFGGMATKALMCIATIVIFIFIFVAAAALVNAIVNFLFGFSIKKALTNNVTKPIGNMVFGSDTKKQDPSQKQSLTTTTPEQSRDIFYKAEIRNGGEVVVSAQIATPNNTSTLVSNNTNKPHTQHNQQKGATIYEGNDSVGLIAALTGAFFAAVENLKKLLIRDESTLNNPKPEMLAENSKETLTVNKTKQHSDLTADNRSTHQHRPSHVLQNPVLEEQYGASKTQKLKIE